VLALALNTPPSFANPKSVLMAALPAVKPAHLPMLQLATGSVSPCLGAKAALLTIPGAPLLYSTAYAHDMVLRVHLPKGQDIDLPLTPDATRGGLVIGDPATMPKGLSGPLQARVHGLWGFDAFSGPEVTMQTAGDWHWQQKGPPKGDGELVLTGAPSSCVAAVTATPALGLTWKSSGPQDISLTLIPSEGKPEAATILVQGPEGTAPASIAYVPLPSRLSPSPSSWRAAPPPRPPIRPSLCPSRWRAPRKSPPTPNSALP
jgi:hypothetical protein